MNLTTSSFGSRSFVLFAIHVGLERQNSVRVPRGSIYHELINSLSWQDSSSKFLWFSGVDTISAAHETHGKIDSKIDKIEDSSLKITGSFHHCLVRAVR